MKTDGKIFDIKRFAIHDGPGIRTTIFFKGCPLNCSWCHNPEALVEQTGRDIKVEQLLGEILKDAIFYEQSGGGVTFSGGEPLLQPQFLLNAVEACKNEDIHVALDTTGFAEPQLFQSVAAGIDLFLYDLKIMDEKSHKKELGVSNQIILKNLEFLNQAQKPTYIRFPVIPGITDLRQNIIDMAAFILSMDCIEKINLLPYHQSASHKYERLRLTNPVIGIEPPSKDKLEQIKQTFLSQGINIPIKIGG